MNTHADNILDLIHNYCVKNGLSEDYTMALSRAVAAPVVKEWLGKPAKKLGRVKLRTSAQNNALHLYCDQLAAALNAAGFDMAHFPYQQGISVPWTAELVKEKLWRSVQMAFLGKRSTTNITTDEVTKIYDIMNRFIGERTGVYVAFPSEESLGMGVY